MNSSIGATQGISNPSWDSGLILVQTWRTFAQVTQHSHRFGQRWENGDISLFCLLVAEDTEGLNGWGRTYTVICDRTGKGSQDALSIGSGWACGSLQNSLPGLEGVHHSDIAICGHQLFNTSYAGHTAQRCDSSSDSSLTDNEALTHNIRKRQHFKKY